MNKVFSIDEMAARLGMTKTQVYRDLQSIPHTMTGCTPSFTLAQAHETELILTADIDSQATRLAALETRMQEIRAADD